MYSSDRTIVRRSILTLAVLIAGALPAAAAEPQAPVPVPAVDSEAVYAIFESACLSGGELPAGFTAAAWSDFPTAVRLLNTYGSPGTFSRRSEPETWFARTRAGAHMMTGIETKCGVAVRSLDKAAVVERLVRHAEAEQTSEIGGGAMTLIIGKKGVFDVTQAEDGWLIVRTTEILIRADSVPSRYRKRKGRKD